METDRSASGPFRGHALGPTPPEDGELTHVGPRTPCGEYMRRFWLPVAMSSQLGDLPVAVRILGEDLVVFRDRGGRAGLLHRHCAHRRASLEFGRIEERGIRCCYHGWRHFNDKDEALRKGKRDEVGWEAVDFYGQTGHRPYEERQRNPGDREAWVGQGLINVHARENLGTTDKGVALLRRKLRRDIRAVQAGDSIERPSGTETDPVRTYGGDTILRIPRRTNDEEGFLREIQHRVAKIYFAGDAYGDAGRIEFIRRELAPLSEG